MTISQPNSFYFRQIFANYDSFNTWVQNENIYIPTFTIFNKSFDNWVFKTLYRKFKNSTIAYYTIDDFLNAFAITLEDNIYMLWRKLQLYNSINAISDNNLQLIQEHAVNNAINDNTELDTPYEYLKFVSNQVYEWTKNDKLSAFIKAYENTYRTGLDEFLNSFKKHFRQVFGSYENFDFKHEQTFTPYATSETTNQGDIENE